MIKLDPEEKIYLITRRHILSLILNLIPAFLFLILFLYLFIIYFFKRISFPEDLSQKLSPEILSLNINYILTFFFSGCLVIIWCIIFFEVTRYYLTYWMITNKRIVAAKFLGFFNVEYITIELNRIQDVSIFIKGILPSIFNFGDVRIQSASEQGEIILDKVGDPEIIKQIIFESKVDIKSDKI
jgi:uncharacterized membrane protein YdbT with pleckstrin-like domain